MDINKLYIFQNENGEIFSYTDDGIEARLYVRKILKKGYIVLVKQLGIVVMFTIQKSRKGNEHGK